MFFQQLLDGHPQLAQFPAQTGIYQTVLPARFNSVDEALDRLCSFGFLRRHFEGVGDIALGDPPRRGEPGTFRLDEATFRAAVRTEAPQGPLTRRDLVIAVARGFLRYAGLDLSRVTTVLEHVHNPSTLAVALEDFPEAKVVNLIREPTVAQQSVLKQYQKEFGVADPRHYYVLLKEHLAGWVLHANPDALLPRERYLAVQVEALNTRGPELMREVAAWLEIENSSELLQPTLGGQWRGPSWGIKKGESAFRGGSKNASLPRDDARRMELLLSWLAPENPYGAGSGAAPSWKDVLAFARPPDGWVARDVEAHQRYAEYQLEFLPLVEQVARAARLEHWAPESVEAVLRTSIVKLLAAKHMVVDPVWYHAMALSLYAQAYAIKDAPPLEKVNRFLRTEREYNFIARGIRALERLRR